MKKRILAILFGVLSLVPVVWAQGNAVVPRRQAAQPQRKADAQLERLRQMTPAQRERVLSLMAPERRRRLEARLAQFDQLNDEERAKLGRRLQSFRELPPEDRQTMRALAGQLNQMDPPRRRVVRQELLRLRALNDTERQSALDSTAFRRRFSADERELLSKLSSLALPEE